MMKMYCPSLTEYQRWKTRCVMVGDVGVGGGNPIRVQSMTTTDTMDTENTISNDYQSTVDTDTIHTIGILSKVGEGIQAENSILLPQDNE